jgi:hypothetical protein
MPTRRPRSIAVARDAVAAIAACGLVFAPVATAYPQAPSPQPDLAASAAPPPPAAGTAGAPAATAEPPTRVGRLASMSGTVSFHTADEDHWDPATLNYPLTTGDALWTEPAATAAVEISASRITMASSTEFDLDQLDEHSVTVTQAQGETFWDLRDLIQGDAFTVRTPRGVVSITAPGQYDVFSGDTQSPTTVSVIQGAVQVNGDNLALALQTGQTATITGTGADGDAFKGTVGPLIHTAFMDTMLSPANAASDTQTETAPGGATATATATASVSAPAIAQQMPGCRDLRHYGTWQQSTHYGKVWRPAVAKDWVPYRDGHWAYIAPWGWTWIDDEAWGFAPFHYGRWVQDDGWVWAPTYYQPGYVTPIYATPVYAPALVTFFGVGPAIAVGAGFGFGIGVGIGIGFGWGWGHVGWAPLGWGEPYHPWFGGPHYYNQVNRYVTNNNTFYNNSVHNTTINNYANAARGSTVVPTSAMVGSQRVSGIGQSLGSANLSQAHLAGTVPSPSGATQGITARQAQAQHLPDAAAAASKARAPGPSLTSRSAGASSTPTAALHGPSAPGAASRPATAAAHDETQARGARPAANTANTHAAATPEHGVAGAPGPKIAAPGAAGLARSGLPALRTAGSMPRSTTGGAPGPAISHQAGTVGATGGASAHGAPGPAITHGSTTANGLPGLRDHATLASASARTTPQSTRPGVVDNAAHGLARQPHTASSNGGHSGGYAAPRSSGTTHAAPRYQHTPSYRGTPREEAPHAYQRSYGEQRAAPQYREPGGAYGRAYDGPRYQQPYREPRYQSPYGGGYGRGYGAPRGEGPRAGFRGGGGRHPFLP